MTYAAWMIYLSPNGLTTEVITHELAHVALHQRIGLHGQSQFPAWVDEGIATYISKDHRFDLHPETCVTFEQNRPQSASAWRRAAGRNEGRDSLLYYGPAGCYVAQWMKAHPITGFDSLIDAYLSPNN
jgi:hypothetical protein